MHIITLLLVREGGSIKHSILHIAFEILALLITKLSSSKIYKVGILQTK